MATQNSPEKSPQEIIFEQLKGQQANLGTGKSFETGAARGDQDGLGSVDGVLRDMASKLAGAGLTSIEQFGRGPVTDKVRVIPETTYAGWLGNNPTPKNPESSVVAQYDDEGTTLMGYMEMAPTGRWKREASDLEGTWYEPLSAEEVKNLGLTGSQPKTIDMNLGRTAFINKATGQELTSLAGYKGKGWAGTGAGDGQTIYNVKFDEATGLPIFYNQQWHGKYDYATELKALAIGTAIFAPQIGAALAPGLAPAAQLAVGSAVSGFVGSGGDLKAGIKAGLGLPMG